MALIGIDWQASATWATVVAALATVLWGIGKTNPKWVATRAGETEQRA